MIKSQAAQGQSSNEQTRLNPQLETFREARRELEASILPLATSVDERRFSFQASLYGLQLQVGGYVMLEGDGPPRLGQVITLELDRLDSELMLPSPAGSAEQTRTHVQLRYASGEGTILEGDPAPFHDVLVRVATGPEVAAWLQHNARHDAQLRLGQLAQDADVPCGADAGGFNRHTFLCGQSGSGKTYSLGVILEQLLTETDLRLVVLDPNSDFVRLGEVRGDADPVLAERFRKAASGVTVYSADAPGERRLRLHAAEIDPATQAAALRLDPIEDREEYAALAEFLATGGSSGWRHWPEATAPRRAAWACGSAISASTATPCGPQVRRVRFSMRSMIRMSAAPSSTSARCPLVRNSRWWPRRCWATCGDGGKSASRSSS